MKSIGVTLGLVLGASGCMMSSVETTRLNQAPHPMVARPVQSVEVYASAPPARPHVDVALLRADQPHYDTDTPRMVEALAKRAAELGCDALFISGPGEHQAAPGNAYLFDPGSRVLFGTCIAYMSQTRNTDIVVANSTPARNAIQLTPPPAEKPTAPPGHTVIRSGGARR